MRDRFAKILATLGPASRSPDTLALLHMAGVDAFRLNFSHGNHADHKKSFDAIRRLEARTGASIAIVADMQGPKLRCGDMGDGLELRYGETVTVREGDGPANGDIVHPHPELAKALSKGVILKFDDGKLQATMLNEREARIDVPGLLTSRKGISVIGAKLPMSAMTDKDRVDMAFALEQGADWIALSFVQTVQDVTDAKGIIQGRAGIIVKIEKPSCVDDLDDILREADAGMVARGDLGVELPLEEVPVVQRRIIRKGLELGKPIIVATHMLESMIDAPTPTRAEASDVATAIYLGADCVMLSAETAVGRHPATAVAIMDRIICAAESDPLFWEPFKENLRVHQSSAEDAVSRSVETIAQMLDAKAVFGFTRTGSTVMRLARERPPCRIIGLTPDKNTASRLALVWGTHPVITDDPSSFEDMAVQVGKIAKTQVELKTGERYMISAGVPFGVPGSTNTLKIDTVG